MHTDVPELRGASRKVVPQWMLVVMHHSGLFDAWRLPIATGIAYVGGGAPRGGELAYYPDGADRPAATHLPRHNTAVVLDTDSVFHGVDRVLGDESGLAQLVNGVRLVHDGGTTWPRTSSASATTRSSFGCRSRGRRTASSTRPNGRRGPRTMTTSRWRSSSTGWSATW